MTAAMDPEATGRLLTRREALALLGASGAATLLGRAASARAQAATLACVARPQQTEGPFFADDAPDRSDIRGDPRSGEVRGGTPLRLRFRVSRLDGAACGPVSGARIDVWHCDAEGRYSEVRGFGSAAPVAGGPFLRGYQLTDAAGAAQFLTIYPGWYGGRAVHVHFKIRTDSAGRTSDFTSQLYFDEALTARVFASEPYAGRGRRWLRNEQDGLFRDGGRQLLLAPQPEGDGYAATFDVALAA